MNTPIVDFVKKYVKNEPLRLHMPGHKGVSLLGFESFDLTEIDGADALYHACGIIQESERNASELFGSETFYSCEGSSLCIRAMIYLTAMYAKSVGKTPIIAAGRNAHKTFLSGAALLDVDIEWIYPQNADSYISCNISPSELDVFLDSSNAAAVYLTSPDYLGNILDIQALSAVCHRHGVLLLVDNAHGAYLKFLSTSIHPIDLGADLCCDSAHKTLPALTGSAYLHISKNAPRIFAENAKNALALFGSTSPSYLVLQSLDAVNRYLSEGYRERLSAFVGELQARKELLLRHGYYFLGNEPLKLTIDAKRYGYMGNELADILSKENMVCEFSDPDVTTMMLTPETGVSGLDRLTKFLISIPQKEEITARPPKLDAPLKVMSIREATLSPSETVSANDGLGRVLASVNIACPPAIPIIVGGESIDENALKLFEYYGIDKYEVIK